jgi:Matrixin
MRLVVAAAAVLAAAVSAAPASAAGTPTAPRVTASVEGEHLTIRTANPDGSGVVQTYTVEQGTSLALLKQLQARGAVSAGTQVVPMSPDPGEDCSGYGTSTFLTTSSTYCTPLRWPKFGAAEADVTVADYTPAAWPVKASANEWSTVDGINLWWRTSCVGGMGCIQVDNVWTSEAWHGSTTTGYNSDGYITYSYIQVNDRFSGVENRSTTCHELGHAIGLDHNSSTSSCMYGYSIGGGNKYPTADDRNTLRYINY